MVYSTATPYCPLTVHTSPSLPQHYNHHQHQNPLTLSSSILQVNYVRMLRAVHPTHTALSTFDSSEEEEVNALAESLRQKIRRRCDYLTPGESGPSPLLPPPLPSVPLAHSFHFLMHLCLSSHFLSSSTGSTSLPTSFQPSLFTSLTLSVSLSLSSSPSQES